MTAIKKNLEDNCLTLILFVFIVAFIVCGAFYFCASTLKDSLYKSYQITVSNDSISGVVYSKSEIDSLVEVIRHHEDALSHKYQSYLHEKEKEDHAQTVIVFVVGAIVSICGFFGYKSFKDIKEQGKEIAKDIAEKQAKEEIDKQLPDLIRREVTNVYRSEALMILEQKVKDSVTQELQAYIDDSIKTKVGEYINSHLFTQSNGSEDNEEKTEQTKDGDMSEELFT